MLPMDIYAMVPGLANESMSQAELTLSNRLFSSQYLSRGLQGTLSCLIYFANAIHLGGEKIDCTMEVQKGGLVSFCQYMYIGVV